jgi:uncharacterized protein
MKNVIGPPVEGEDFFGREKEFEYVWSRIQDGNNLIFPSPRRVGKTSFALKLVEAAKAKKWNVVSINVEKVTSETEFVENFIEKLKELSWLEKLKEGGNNLIEKVKKLKLKAKYEGVDFSLDWDANKVDIYKQITNVIAHDEPTLIFIDELTVLLKVILESSEDGKKEVKHFLHWLREIRQTSKSKIRWIYCSSVGIENFTHTHGISDTVNDLSDYSLKSFSKDDSIKMLAALSKTYDLEIGEDIAKSIVEKLNYCLPYFLQLIFEKINSLTKIEEVPLNIAIVEMAYGVLTGEDHFNTWVERITEQYGENEANAFAILKLICEEKTGTSRANILNNLLVTGIEINKAEAVTSQLIYMLNNDGYLIEENSLYRFRSPLLRDFWFNRFSK